MIFLASALASASDQHFWGDVRHSLVDDTVKCLIVALHRAHFPRMPVEGKTSIAFFFNTGDCMMFASKLAL